jgi:hypothetical protein
LKDETILDVREGNNLEEAGKEFSEQSIVFESESIFDGKAMSETKTDVSTNVEDNSIYEKVMRFHTGNILILSLFKGTKY